MHAAPAAKNIMAISISNSAICTPRLDTKKHETIPNADGLKQALTNQAGSAAGPGGLQACPQPRARSAHSLALSQGSLGLHQSGGFSCGAWRPRSMSSAEEAKRAQLSGGQSARPRVRVCSWWNRGSSGGSRTWFHAGMSPTRRDDRYHTVEYDPSIKRQLASRNYL